MIPNNAKTATVTGNLGDTDDFEMKISAAATVHLMGLLTDLYSDEELACIREYSTNAWDSHIQAGVTRPIEVSTPTRLSPFLSIKDFGVGMDKATIRDVYSQYGESNKRTETTTNGSMGIGGKCGLAYSTQFTVIGIKDGMKTTVLVSRREDGSGVMSVLDESKTDEPNGVEIMIPAKAYNCFEEKAREFFQFWHKGTVLLNGSDPHVEMRKISDRIYLHEGHGDYIFMGNVPYPVSGGYSISGGVSNGVVAYVTMNGDDEVVFTPNREALIYNPITTNAISGLQEEFNEYFKDFLSSALDACKDHMEAYQKYNEFTRTYGRGILEGITYKGDDFIQDHLFVETDDGSHVNARCLNWKPNRSRNSVRGESMSITMLQNASVIITGYKGSSGGVSSDHKRRIKDWAVSNGLSINGGYYSSVVLFKEDVLPGGVWTKHFQTYKWADIMKATRKERESSGTGFSYGEAYDVYNPDTNCYEVDTIDNPDAKVLYYTPASHYVPNDLAKRICEMDEDIVIVSATANRHGKLKRLYPNAEYIYVNKYMKEIGEQQFEELTDEDKETLLYRHMYEEYYYNNDYGVSQIEAFRNVDSILDPEYADAVRKYHRDIKLGDYISHSSSYVKFKAGLSNKGVIKFGELYPLMNWRDNAKATVEYINAMYTIRKGN